METDLFSKPTNTHQYLHFNSFHSRHIPNNLPYSLALRIIRVCSSLAKRNRRLQDLKSQLSYRNYPLSMVNRAINRALTHSREDLLRVNYQPSSSQKLPFITPFSASIKLPLRGAVFDHLPMLQRSSTMSHILQNNTPVLAFQRTKNLRDFLVRAQIGISGSANGFFFV